MTVGLFISRKMLLLSVVVTIEHKVITASKNPEI